MTTEEMLQLPHTETIGSETIQFPRLETDDLIAWAAEAKAKAKSDEEIRVRNDTTLRGNIELQQKCIQLVASREVEFGHLMQRAVFTPAGTKKALVLSLKKTGKSDSEILATLKRIHFSRQKEIAEIIMSAPPAEMAESDKPPLTQSDTEETGPASEQS